MTTGGKGAGDGSPPAAPIPHEVQKAAQLIAGRKAVPPWLPIWLNAKAHGVCAVSFDLPGRADMRNRLEAVGRAAGNLASDLKGGWLVPFLQGARFPADFGDVIFLIETLKEVQERAKIAAQAMPASGGNFQAVPLLDGEKRPAHPSPRLYIAMAIIAAWHRVRGRKPDKGNVKAQEAATLLWQTTKAGAADASGGTWEFWLQKARQVRAEVVPGSAGFLLDRWLVELAQIGSNPP